MVVTDRQTDRQTGREIGRWVGIGKQIKINKKVDMYRQIGIDQNKSSTDTQIDRYVYVDIDIDIKNYLEMN